MNPGEGASCALERVDETSLADAVAARLVISSDCEPGIRRVRRADGFAYIADTGERLSEEQLARIEALRIPPAWAEVWICADSRGHLQATGRDARGRKQYRYHEQWRAVRDGTKFERMLAFGEALPRIRRAVDRDLRRPRLDRARVLALVVAVLDATLIRVGNSAYLRENESFGLTTLRTEHAEVGRARVRLRFRGKAGKDLDVGIDDPRIARAIGRVRELPGQELFQYLDEDGEPKVIGSGDVNEYLRELAGTEVTSKDFRTWGGSLTFTRALVTEPGKPSQRAVTAALRHAADALGNTPAVCKRSYVHPGIAELYLGGGLGRAWAEAGSEPADEYQSEDERLFLGLVRRL